MWVKETSLKVKDYNLVLGEGTGCMILSDLGKGSVKCGTSYYKSFRLLLIKDIPRF